MDPRRTARAILSRPRPHRTGNGTGTGFVITVGFSQTSGEDSHSRRRRMTSRLLAKAVKELSEVAERREGVCRCVCVGQLIPVTLVIARPLRRTGTRGDMFNKSVPLGVSSKVIPLMPESWTRIRTWRRGRHPPPPHLFHVKQNPF